MIRPQTLKGFRDFLPKEARKRQYVIDALKGVFESFGFEPLETPTLEYEEILLGKYGEEGDKLMYRFIDRGGRKVAMRYDQTVPLARAVAEYSPRGEAGQNELPMPFKRYQIQNVWRAENTQKGRFREFLQCDADIVGLSSPLSDAEILALTYCAYKKLGLDVLIKINDRALLKTISTNALATLDKLNKIGEEGVVKELQQRGFTLQQANDLLNQSNALKTSLYLNEVMDLYKKMGYPIESLTFEGTLVRGLDYYTGLIFEVVLKSDPNSSSLCGGGRYDNLIGMFAGKKIPAVGFAIGFDRTLQALEESNLFSIDLQTTKVLVTIFSPELLQKSLEVSSQLRSNNMSTELYLDKNTPLEKQLKYANQKQIPYVVIIGPDEAKTNSVTLRNMKERTEKTIPQENLVNEINS